MGVEEKLDVVLSELRGLRADLQSDPRKRVSPYTVKELAKLARRHPNYISERCRVGVIAHLPGKPYRIPPGSAARFLGL
jgi:hypothetical protein